MLVGILVGACEGGGVGISVGAGVGVKVSTETLSVVEADQIRPEAVDAVGAIAAPELLGAHVRRIRDERIVEVDHLVLVRVGPGPTWRLTCGWMSSARRPRLGTRGSRRGSCGACGQLLGMHAISLYPTARRNPPPSGSPPNGAGSRATDITEIGGCTAGNLNEEPGSNQSRVAADAPHEHRPSDGGGRRR